MVFYSEDALFFANCMVRSSKCARIKEELYAYVGRGQSATHEEYNPKQWTEVSAWNKIVNQTKCGPANLYKSAESFYLLNCSAIMSRMLFSPYYESEKAQFLIREIRKHRRAISYIPKSRYLLRGRMTAMLLFPRLTSVLLRWRTDDFLSLGFAILRASR